MSADPRHTLGRLGEGFAAEHLERLGLRIVARNHRTRFGEIDLVACDDRRLIFCEVKTRHEGSGSPWDALTEAKQGQVRAMARAYLASSAGERPRVAELRFDAIGITIDRGGRLVRLDHLEGAF
jgi:putative endonuclease